MMPSLEGLAEQVPLEEPVAQNFQRGKALLRLGLLARAREELSRVHRVAHRHPQVLMDLLRLYWELQLHGDALRLAEQVRRYSDQPSWKEDLEPFLYPEGYTETVDREARKYGLDPHLLLAVIRVESRFDPLAVSPAGALGLMQIMPSTGAEIEEQLGLSSNPAASPFGPDLNVRLGSYYLWRQLEAFGGQPELALAAYNAGPGNVRRWLRWLPTAEPELFVELIDFAETREFIKRVLTTQALYGRIWGAQG
jgi:soluble lytic murein transglycosylase